MPEFMKPEILKRLMEVPFDRLDLSDQLAAQAVLLWSPERSADVLHPETVRKWITHCYGRNNGSRSRALN